MSQPIRGVGGHFVFSIGPNNTNVVEGIKTCFLSSFVEFRSAVSEKLKLWKANDGQRVISIVHLSFGSGALNLLSGSYHSPRDKVDLYFTTPCPKSRVFLPLTVNTFGVKFQSLENIVAAFRGMHASPAKHSYAWLPRKWDYQTDTQMQKWSLCATILRRGHKNYNLGLASMQQKVIN